MHRRDHAGSERLAQRLPELEAAVADAFGVQSVIILRAAKQIRELASARPFGSDTPKSHVAFLAEKPDRAALRSLLELDVALQKLEQLDRQGAQVVELRFFSGLTVPEVAMVLGVSRATVEREWTLAKAWLGAGGKGARSRVGSAGIATVGVRPEP